MTRGRRGVSRGRNPEWPWAAGLFALACLAYLPAWKGSFVWDDSFMVADNLMLRNARGLHDLWFTTRAADPYPITMTALWVQWHLFGSHAAGYHIVNVLGHACGALLLWRVLLRLLGAWGPGLSWLAAAVFAVHPVAAASAAWISEEKNTVSMIFYLPAILYYLRFTDRGYGLALLFFVCALLSKGSVVMLPVVLLIILRWRNGRITRVDLFRVAPFFVLSAGASLVTVWFQNHKAIAGEMVQDLSLPARILAAAWAVCFYFWKAVMPLNLCVIYPAPSVATQWAAVFVLAAVLLAGWLYRKTWGRHLLLGLGCFVATLFPVMGFFNMYFLVFSRVADHWQYLALPAAVSLVVFSLGYWFDRIATKLRPPKMTGPLASAALLLCLFLATWSRVAVYRSERTLWTDTVKKNPQAWMAWNNLGNALGAAGDMDGSIESYRKALAVKTTFPDAASNLGNALVAQGQLNEALGYLQKAVEEEPQMARFHFNYGVALADQGNLDAAVAQYNTALQLQPALGDARNNLSNVLLKQKKFSAALSEAELAIQLKPGAPEPYLNAAHALESLGRIDEAARDFETNLSMRPNNAGAQYEYGMLLAMHGNLPSALPHFQAVVRLKPQEFAGHGSLGNTLAGLNRLPEATAEFREALRLRPNDSQTENNLANVLAEQGNLAEAIAHYSLALQLKSDDAGTRANFARVLLRAGRRDDAIAQYRAALQLKPGDAPLQQQLDAALRQ